MNNIGYIEKLDGTIVRVEALGDKCVIQLDEPPKMSGLVHLPDRQYTAGKRSNRARIIAVGPDVSSPLKPDDRVHVSAYSGTAFDLGEPGGHEYHAVTEANILGVERDDELQRLVEDLNKIDGVHVSASSTEIDKLIEDWHRRLAQRARVRRARASERRIT